MKAFPASSRYNDEYNGMDLRDYFAAKALQGLLSSTNNANALILAKDCYVMADAMMEARK